MLYNFRGNNFSDISSSFKDKAILLDYRKLTSWSVRYYLWKKNLYFPFEFQTSLPLLYKGNGPKKCWIFFNQIGSSTFIFNDFLSLFSYPILYHPTKSFAPCSYFWRIRTTSAFKDGFDIFCKRVALRPSPFLLDRIAFETRTSQLKRRKKLNWMFLNVPSSHLAYSLSLPSLLSRLSFS